MWKDKKYHKCVAEREAVLAPHVEEGGAVCVTQSPRQLSDRNIDSVPVNTNANVL